MAVPISIAAILRTILWIALFGILADLLNDVIDNFNAEDNLFWLCLSLAAFDVGPLICLAVDYWIYYGKFDYNGLLGHKNNPLRCATGQSIVLFVCSWAFIAMFEELGDPQFLWPWILHGVFTTVILIFAAFLQFSGSIKGAVVSSAIFKFVAWGLGAVLLILGLIIYGYLLSWIFHPIWALLAGVWLVYGLYYTGMILPAIWALFSVKSGSYGDEIQTP